MPNWCTNEIFIIFDEKLSVEKQLEVDQLLKEGENDFSLSKIIQPPEILINCSIGVKTRENKSKWFKKYRDKAPRYIVYSCLDNNEYYYEINNEWVAVDYFKEEGVELNKDEYIETWYDWNLANWGTKWNSETFYKSWEVDDEGNSFLDIRFNTAWGFGAEQIITETFAIIKKAGFKISLIEGVSEEPGNDIDFNYQAYDENGVIIYCEEESESKTFVCDKCGDIHECKQDFGGCNCNECEEGIYHER